MIQNVTNAVLNTLFVSIPEILLWLIFSLILLKEKNLLDTYFWRENLKKAMLPVVIPVAISINLMRYIFHVDNLLNFVTIEVMMCILVIRLIRENNFLNEKLNYFKIIFYVILADFIVIVTTEGICVLVITYMLNMTIEQINNNITYNILLSILPRIFQMLLISFALYKQSFGKMVNCMEIILKNKVLTISMIIFSFTVLVSNFVFQRFIIGMNYLEKYVLIIKFGLTLLMVLIPVIIIVSYIVSVFSLLLENNKLRQEKDNLYDNNRM